jgi:hypothetical protein
MFDYVRLSIVAILLASCFQASNKEQGPPIGTQALPRGVDGCAQGMRLMEFDSLAKSVCFPDDIIFRTEKRVTPALNLISLNAFIPSNSSPLIHTSFSLDDAFEGGSYNTLGEKHLAPESDVVIYLDILISSSYSTWEDPEETIDDEIFNLNTIFKLIKASPDTLGSIDRWMHEVHLSTNSPPWGEAWGQWSRSNVQWKYVLWVRHIAHSGQIRAGLESYTMKGDMHARVFSHWVRDALPETLDELRSDSMFVIATEVVDSFEWSE